MGEEHDASGEPTPLVDQNDRAARLEELWEIHRQIREDTPDDVTSNHDWLYDDETGLPK